MAGLDLQQSTAENWSSSQLGSQRQGGRQKAVDKSGPIVAEWCAGLWMCTGLIATAEAGLAFRDVWGEIWAACDREAKIVNFQQKHKQASRDAWICFWQDGHNRGGVVSFRPLMADDCVNYSRAGRKVVIYSYTRTFVAQQSPTANSFPQLSTFSNTQSISLRKSPKILWRYNSKSVTVQGRHTIQVYWNFVFLPTCFISGIPLVQFNLEFGITRQLRAPFQP